MINIQWKWEDLCGPLGLNPWNETTKDIGLCFQNLFMDVPISFIIALISGYYVGYRKDWVIREKLQERAIILRSLIVLCLALIPVIRLYVIITNPQSMLYSIDYFTAGTACLSWLVHFGYLIGLKQRLGPSPRGPLILIVFWSVSAVLTIIGLRSDVLTSTPIWFDLATLFCHIIYFLTLIPSEGQSRSTYYSHCLVGSQHSHSEYVPLLPHIDESVLGTAMQGSGLCSRVTFGWVEPLFRKGLVSALSDPDEVFELPIRCRCGYISARIDRALIGNIDQYQHFVEQPVEPFMGSGYGATGETSSVASPISRRVLSRPLRRHNVSLLRGLHTCFGWQFYSIGMLKFLSDSAGFAGPLILNKLVTYVEDNSVDIHMGYIYASGLLASSLASALFTAHFNWFMSLVGLKMRGAVISTVLRKTISVNSAELSRYFTIGEITNFMSIDTDRIVNSCPSFHALWSIPLQLFVTLFLMYQQVGISFLAGVAFAVILIPINKYIANKIGELSTELMKYKDNRVSLMSDLLRGVRTIKLHVWEDYFINKISEKRKGELLYLRGRKYLDAICVVLWATTPVLVAALTLGVHSLRGITLTAPTVFTTVALVNMLIAPLNAFPWVLNGLTEAWVSLKRIQRLLELPDMDEEQYYDKIDTNRDEDKIIILKDTTFSWVTPSPTKKIPKKSRKNKGKSKNRFVHIQRRDSTSSGEFNGVNQDEPFMLKNISMEVGRGQLIGIAGTVGSGKSTLLHAILGDMLKKSGEIQILENLDGFGYVSQRPWLKRGTIRDNILFGKPYDESRFRAVIGACALSEDMEVLGWGVSVGEGGCTLSGGQRARVALARAVYQDKQVYLLDDALAGVDARVSNHIVQHCILGLLKHKTRIIITHSQNLLACADTVLLLRNGRIIKQGPPDDVLPDVEEIAISETEILGEEPLKKVATPKVLDQKDNISRDSITNEEDMSKGTVDWWVIGMYIKAVGPLLSVAILLSLILMQVSQNFTFLWLSYWVSNQRGNSTGWADQENKTILDHGFYAIDDAVHSIINATKSFIINEKRKNFENLDIVENSSNDANNFYLYVYFGLAGLNLLFTIIRAFLFAYGGVQAAGKIHRSLLKIIIKAKVKFFDVTPAGRILNRFSSDTYTVDDSLPFILNILLAQFFSLIGAFAVTLYGLPWLCVALVPLLPIYYWLQHRYRITSRQLKRLQSVTLSPIYSHFSDTLDGKSTIRAFCAGNRTLCAGEDLVEVSQRVSMSAAAASQWLSLRLQFIGVVIVTGAALVATAQKQFQVANAGLVGLAISYALSMTSMLGNMMNAFTETEREMIAVERVGEYIRQVEIESTNGDTPTPYGWPSQGVISFENVVLKYSDREHAPLALDGVEWSTRPGERIGVVGRTGSGKSSMLNVITRVVEPSSGRILVDSVDVSKVPLPALRSRICVVPQEPFIWSGSVHENVDPLRQYTVGEVWRAIERCGAREAIESKGGLQVSAPSLSRGHQQLLCLTRALLRRAKVVLLDEATASVDHETERQMLETVRSSFTGCTVVMVAHRVAAVLDCERVLVMGAGKVLELNTPDTLLSDPSSYFYNLVHANGH